MRPDTHKLTYYALCLAAALALSYVEALIPIGLGVPGAKVGLPNIVSILLIYTTGTLPALTVGVMRVMLSGFMFANFFAIVYSLAGLLMSITVMSLLKRTELFGIVGVSVAGGVAHNMGQLLVAAAVTNSYIFYYGPMLIALGVAAGLVIGVVGGIITTRLAPFLRKSLCQS